MRHTLLIALAVMILQFLPLSPGAAAQDAGEATPGPEISGSYNIGDRSLFLDCIGAGSPTVIIDHGQGGTGMDFFSLQHELAEDSRVCIYDRAGQSRSDPVPFPRRASDVVADLHQLLSAAAVPGPYVLVGQSAGGTFVQLYALTYPGEVAGVVAMNPVPPTGPWLEGALPLMTEQERAEEEAYYSGEGEGEQFDWYASFAELESAADPPDVPFLVLISTIAQCDYPGDVCGRTYGVYETVMREVADTWPRGQYQQLETGHEIYQDPEAVAAIRSVMEAVRNPGMWATPAATP